MEQTLPLMARGQSQDPDTERPPYRVGIKGKAGTRLILILNPVGGHEKTCFYPDLLLCFLGRCVCEREGMNCCLRLEWSNLF